MFGKAFHEAAGVAVVDGNRSQPGQPGYRLAGSSTGKDQVWLQQAQQIVIRLKQGAGNRHLVVGLQCTLILQARHGRHSHIQCMQAIQHRQIKGDDSLWSLFLLDPAGVMLELECLRGQTAGHGQRQREGRKQMFHE